MATRELQRSDIEQWRAHPYQLASADTRDGKRKQFYANADGWYYVHVNDVLISTWDNDLQSALDDYNSR